MRSKIVLWQLHIPEADFSDGDLDEAFGEQGKFWGVHPFLPDQGAELHIWGLTPDPKGASEEQEALIGKHCYNWEWWEKAEDVWKISVKYPEQFEFKSIAPQALEALTQRGYAVANRQDISAPFRSESDGEGGWNYFLPDGMQFWADQEGNLELGNGIKNA